MAAVAACLKQEPDEAVDVRVSADAQLAELFDILAPVTGQEAQADAVGYKEDADGCILIDDSDDEEGEEQLGQELAGRSADSPGAAALTPPDPPSGAAAGAAGAGPSGSAARDGQPARSAAQPQALAEATDPAAGAEPKGAGNCSVSVPRLIDTGDGAGRLLPEGQQGQPEQQGLQGQARGSAGVNTAVLEAPPQDPDGPVASPVPAGPGETAPSGQQDHEPDGGALQPQPVGEPAEPVGMSNGSNASSSACDITLRIYGNRSVAWITRAQARAMFSGDGSGEVTLLITQRYQPQPADSTAPASLPSTPEGSDPPPRLAAATLGKVEGSRWGLWVRRPALEALGVGDVPAPPELLLRVEPAGELCARVAVLPTPPPLGAPPLRAAPLPALPLQVGPPEAEAAVARVRRCGSGTISEADVPPRGGSAVRRRGRRRARARGEDSDSDWVGGEPRRMRGGRAASRSRGGGGRGRSGGRGLGRGRGRRPSSEESAPAAAGGAAANSLQLLWALKQGLALAARSQQVTPPGACSVALSAEDVTSGRVTLNRGLTLPSRGLSELIHGPGPFPMALNLSLEGGQQGGGGSAGGSGGPDGGGSGGAATSWEAALSESAAGATCLQLSGLAPILARLGAAAGDRLLFLPNESPTAFTVRLHRAAAVPADPSGSQDPAAAASPSAPAPTDRSAPSASGLPPAGPPPTSGQQRLGVPLCPAPSLPQPHAAPPPLPQSTVTAALRAFIQALPRRGGPLQPGSREPAAPAWAPRPDRVGTGGRRGGGRAGAATSTTGAPHEGAAPAVPRAVRRRRPSRLALEVLHDALRSSEPGSDSGSEHEEEQGQGQAASAAAGGSASGGGGAAAGCGLAEEQPQLRTPAAAGAEAAGGEPVCATAAERDTARAGGAAAASVGAGQQPQAAPGLANAGLANGGPAADATDAVTDAGISDWEGGPSGLAVRRPRRRFPSSPGASGWRRSAAQLLPASPAEPADAPQALEPAAPDALDWAEEGTASGPALQRRASSVGARSVTSSAGDAPAGGQGQAQALRAAHEQPLPAPAASAQPSPSAAAGPAHCQRHVTMVGPGGAEDAPSVGSGGAAHWEGSGPANLGAQGSIGGLQQPATPSAPARVATAMASPQPLTRKRSREPGDGSGCVDEAEPGGEGSCVPAPQRRRLASPNEAARVRQGAYTADPAAAVPAAVMAGSAASGAMAEAPTEAPKESQPAPALNEPTPADAPACPHAQRPLPAPDGGCGAGGGVPLRLVYAHGSSQQSELPVGGGGSVGEVSLGAAEGLGAAAGSAGLEGTASGSDGAAGEQPAPPHLALTEEQRKRLPAPSLSAAHLQGCALSRDAVPPPALQPGELRLCGLTFHPELAPGVRSAMEAWEAGLAEQLAADGLTGGLADAKPERAQIRVLGAPALDAAGIRPYIIVGNLAELLGLRARWDAPLPEHAPQLGPGSLAPGPDEGRGGAGLFAAAALRKGAVLGVMGGYVMPKAAARRFRDQAFLFLPDDAKAELAARAVSGAGEGDVWELVESAFRLPMPGSPDTCDLSMLGYGSLAALINDPRREPRSWVEGNDVGDEGGAAARAANCAVVPVSVRGLTLPVVVALRDIQPGDQLLRNYGAEWWHAHEQAWGTAEDRGLTAQAALHPRAAEPGLAGSGDGSGREEAMPQAETALEGGEAGQAEPEANPAQPLGKRPRSRSASPQPGQWQRLDVAG
ncbi:hypothetical protein HYH03_006432 [Edaphochlamys debaryana]|uniref:SET domain-containing protein n=1 Tax=Edaphochlamys debaryana TaxID=47281 RepID=A0A835Y683_9CHLO|nr:hypothetical protein HYH03_006432 [Edaphochlamys debaryana]|eukprot:KAG2495488.1 hypothetical protein HYH03_006432 [Edaphochlamys debaryana]